MENTVRPCAGSSGQRDIRANHRLRVVTYNIHSCINMDGRINPDRTADVIAGLEPDIAMLQEVDVNRRRTHSMHQGKYLAKRLGLTCRFFPVVRNGDEHYGLALLSRYPFAAVKNFHLPHIQKRWWTQSRGAMLAVIDTPMGSIRVVNTHLGLRGNERRQQVRAMLGNEWLRRSLRKKLPFILAGDFNAGARSRVYRKITNHLSDVQTLTAQKGYPKRTFSSRYPIFRLDHIFVSKHFRPGLVMVPRDDETRMVSDHLPLSCELGPADLRGAARPKCVG